MVSALGGGCVGRRAGNRSTTRENVARFGAKVNVVDIVLQPKYSPRVLQVEPIRDWIRPWAGERLCGMIVAIEGDCYVCLADGGEKFLVRKTDVVAGRAKVFRPRVDEVAARFPFLAPPVAHA